MKKRTVLVSAMAMVACIALAIFLFSGRAVPPSLGAGESVDTMRTQWSSYIQQAGGRRGVSALTEQGRALSYSEAHTLAYVIGGVLFDQGERISVCVRDFGYGCFHGYMERALAENGTAATSVAASDCRIVGTSASECMHGLGYGIIASLGIASLHEALTICVPLQDVRSSVGGCFGGVFTGYLFDMSRGEKNYTPRTLNLPEPYAPCMSDIPPLSRGACFYALALKWRILLAEKNTSAEEQFRTIGQLCSALQDIESRTTCFRGLGSTVEWRASADLDTVRVLCSNVASEEGESMCAKEARTRIVGESL